MPTKTQEIIAKLMENLQTAANHYEDMAVVQSVGYDADENYFPVIRDSGGNPIQKDIVLVVSSQPATEIATDMLNGAVRIVLPINISCMVAKQHGAANVAFLRHAEDVIAAAMLATARNVCDVTCVCRTGSSKIMDKSYIIEKELIFSFYCVPESLQEFD